MNLLMQIGILLGAYILGSLPFGFIIVKLRTGKDIRDVQSGRTGGTNAMRAAGFAVGLLTALMDIGKGYLSVMMAKNIAPESVLIHALAGVATIIGHNYSIFLIQRSPEGKLRLGGGAGGAAALGGAMGLWPPAGLFIFGIGVLIFYFVGYASVTTMSIALLAILIFAYRAMLGLSPWMYVVYGILAEFLLVWALRPNIKRLREGTERMHGFRTRNKKKEEAE